MRVSFKSALTLQGEPGRLRSFWTVEGNNLVSKLIEDLIAYGQESDAFRNDSTLYERYLLSCHRLSRVRFSSFERPMVSLVASARFRSNSRVS